jgi:hypothetical protein
MVDRIRPAHMSAKNAKSGSARTIFRKRDGAYVAVRDEGGVTRIYWLNVVKSNPRDNLVTEPDRARVLPEAAVTGVTADALEFSDVAGAIGEYARSVQLHPNNDAVER